MELYLCKEYGLKYKTEELALKCEEWCSKHNSCNLELAKKSIRQ